MKSLEVFVPSKITRCEFFVMQYVIKIRRITMNLYLKSIEVECTYLIVLKSTCQTCKDTYYTLI